MLSPYVANWSAEVAKSTDGRPARKRKQLITGCKLAISIILILIVISRIDFARSLTLFAHANGRLILLGACLIFVQTGLSAAKWRVLLRGQGIEIPFLKLLKSYLLANFVNLFTPGFVGGDAYRSISISAYTGGVARSLSSVLTDRITGFVVLIMLAAAGLGFYFEPSRPWLVGVVILAALALGYLLFIFAVSPVLRPRLLGREPRVYGLARDLIAALQPTRILWTAFAIAFVFQVNIIFIVCIWSAGLHLSASIAQLFLIVPAVYMLEVLPISLSGVGLREGAYAVLFATFDLPPDQGVALGLLTSILRYVVGAAGAMAWFLPDMPVSTARS